MDSVSHLTNAVMEFGSALMAVMNWTVVSIDTRTYEHLAYFSHISVISSAMFISSAMYVDVDDNFTCQVVDPGIALRPVCIQRVIAPTASGSGMLGVLLPAQIIVSWSPASDSG